MAENLSVPAEFEKPKAKGAVMKFFVIK